MKNRLSARGWAVIVLAAVGVLAVAYFLTPLVAALMAWPGGGP